MCNFILASVEEEHAHIFKKGMRYHMSETNSNEWINKFHKNDASYFITNGHCSCEFTYNMEEKPPITDEDIEELKTKTIEKLSKPKQRKHGWTQEKIEEEVIILKFYFRISNG